MVHLERLGATDYKPGNSNSPFQLWINTYVRQWGWANDFVPLKTYKLTVKWEMVAIWEATRPGKRTAYQILNLWSWVGVPSFRGPLDPTAYSFCLPIISSAAKLVLILKHTNQGILLFGVGRGSFSLSLSLFSFLPCKHTYTHGFPIETAMEYSTCDLSWLTIIHSIISTGLAIKAIQKPLTGWAGFSSFF